MIREKVHAGVWWGKKREGDHLDNIKMYLPVVRWGRGKELDQSGSEFGQVANSSECGNEPSGSTKCGKLID
jgi:hypothetical protein